MPVSGCGDLCKSMGTVALCMSVGAVNKPSGHVQDKGCSGYVRVKRVSDLV